MILWEEWKYPEIVDICETNPAQVLMSEVQVRYYGTKEISCEIVDDEIIEKWRLPLHNITNNLSPLLQHSTARRIYTVILVD